MALLKLPFKLGRPSNDTPVTSTDAVDDETLQKTQAELNFLFNQGKNSQGEQVGKTYSAGTGISLSGTNNTEINLNSDVQQKLSDVVAIKEKIPNAASSLNKLADKDFVNSTVGTNTAYYISDNGQPFASLAALQAYSGTLTNHDYAFVVGADAEGNTTYTRYKYSSATSSWAAEYVLNNSSFTAEQWAAIQSGITAALVGKLSDLPTRAGLTTELGNKANKSLITSSSEAANAESATTAHAKGSYFFIGDVLYRALDAIAENGAIVTDSTMSGYNAAAVTIEGEMGRCINGMQPSTKAPFSGLLALTTFISDNSIPLHTNDYAFIIEASGVSDTRKALKLYKYDGSQWGQDCEMLKVGNGLGWTNNVLTTNYSSSDEFVQVNVSVPSGYSLQGKSISYYVNNQSTPVAVSIDVDGNNNTSGVATFRIYVGDSYVISPPIISGLETINPIRYTATFTARTVTLNYQETPVVTPMEAVHVFVGKRNSYTPDSFVGVSVTVVNVATGSTIYSGNTDARGVVNFNVPIGVTYRISVNDIIPVTVSGTTHNYYIASSNPQRYTAEQETRSITFEYRDDNAGVFAIYYNENNTSDLNNGQYTKLELEAKISDDPSFDVGNIKYILIATQALLNAEETPGVHAKFLIDVDAMRTRNYVSRVWQSPGNITITNLGGIDQYNGLAMCEAIIAAVSTTADISSVPAVSFAYSLTATIGDNSYRGFLGTKYQLQQLWSIKDTVDDILDIVRPEASKPSGVTYYHLKDYTVYKSTSSQTGPNAICVWSSIAVDNGLKTSPYVVIPFFSYQH